MEGRTLNRFRILFLAILVFSGGLFSTTQIGTTSAFAFFENQTQYAFQHRWLPMLSDASPEKRFQAMRAFLVYPEWGLPVLRNSIMNSDSENVSWQIVMLIGFLGDSSDVPHLLKIWRELENIERSEVWLGAMQRLYWKNHVSGGASPKLTSLTVNFLAIESAAQNDEKTVLLAYRIDNPARSPRFIRVSGRFWKTRIQENLPAKYYWLPARGRIESSMQTRFLAVDHTNDVRLDFRVWEVGLSEQLLHQTINIPIPEEKTSSVVD
jgi:hypothetical protein